MCVCVCDADVQVQYHADFEKAKGKFTQVADDPETLRIKANSKIIRSAFIYLFIHLFIYLFIYSYVCLFVINW